MKITNLTTYRVAPRWMFLKMETDKGVTGWGEPVIEGRARSVETAVQELSQSLIGQDPALRRRHGAASARRPHYSGFHAHLGPPVRCGGQFICAGMGSRQRAGASGACVRRRLRCCATRFPNYCGFGAGYSAIFQDSSGFRSRVQLTTLEQERSVKAN
ncbi:MAG: hypothetical protein H7176_04225 [Bdellovibrionales bacterium]|nr:hypothetical protein [Massilia sp.]